MPERRGGAAFTALRRAIEGGASLPKTLVIVAHPDDETIGASTLLGRCERLRVVHVTDGSPRDLRDARNAGCADRGSYAALRHEEAIAALALCGVPADAMECWQITDQEAALHLPKIVAAIEKALQDFAPRWVLTHAYEGGHPDHDAVAFATHLACEAAGRRGAAPTLIEMAGYHAGPEGMVSGVFLPAECEGEIDVELDEALRARKAAMFAAFASQRGVLAAFGIGRERFRVAPSYDFREAPHAGRLFYENFPWGMSASFWKELSRSVLASRVDASACAVPIPSRVPLTSGAPQE